MKKNNKMIKYLSEQLNPEYKTSLISSDNINIIIQDGNNSRSSFETQLFAIKYMIENLELHWEIKDNDYPFLVGNTVLELASALGELIRYDVFDDEPEYRDLSSIEVLNKLTSEVINRKYFNEEYEQLLEEEHKQKIIDEEERKEHDELFQEMINEIKNRI